MSRVIVRKKDLYLLVMGLLIGFIVQVFYDELHDAYKYFRNIDSADVAWMFIQGLMMLIAFIPLWVIYRRIKEE